MRRALFVALTFAACTEEPPPAQECEFDVDCGTPGVICEDNVCTEYCVDIPPNDACLSQCGNELGVGQPCTAGGGECNFWLEAIEGNFIVCTVDFVPDAELAMCTKPCVDDSDCGSNARCLRDPDDPDSNQGCVPASCAPDPCTSDDECDAPGTTCQDGECLRFCPDLEPSDDCLSRCGNELGIGQPCTAGGGECAFWAEEIAGNDVVCTTDLVADDPLSMCTKSCVEDGQCGEGAVCAEGRCVPEGCVEG